MPTDYLERIPPQSLEAEQSVLGAMLLEREAAEIAVELVQPEDFYRTQHRLLFVTMRELLQQHQPIDLIIMINLLKDREQLEEIGGTLYLTTLMAQVPTAAGIKHYSEIVVSLSQRRKLIKAADEIMHTAYTTDAWLRDDVLGIIDDAESRILAIREQRDLLDIDEAQISKLMWKEFLRMEQEHAQGEPAGVKTNIDALNDILSPLQPGGVGCVAACTSVGKSVFLVQNIGIPNAQRGIVTAHFTLEMSQAETAMRCLAANSINTEAWHMKYLNYRKANWESFSDATRNPHDELAIEEDLIQTIDRARQWPYFVFYTPGATVTEIISICQRLKRKYGLGLVTIDGLWLMSGERKREDDRTREVGYISRAIKSKIAGGLHVPVWYAHQLNREAVKSDRPALYHLRESGDVEQDIDAGVLIYREGYTDPTKRSMDGLAELIVAKHRNGPTGVAKCWFNAGRTRFVDLQQEERR